HGTSQFRLFGRGISGGSIQTDALADSDRRASADTFLRRPLRERSRPARRSGSPDPASQLDISRLLRSVLSGAPALHSLRTATQLCSRTRFGRDPAARRAGRRKSGWAHDSLAWVELRFRQFSAARNQLLRPQCSGYLKHLLSHHDCRRAYLGTGVDDTISASIPSRPGFAGVLAPARGSSGISYGRFDGFL